MRIIEAGYRRTGKLLYYREELVRQKQSVAIRLDADIVAWFKEQGGQHQTLINEVLRRC